MPQRNKVPSALFIPVDRRRSWRGHTPLKQEQASPARPRCIGGAREHWGFKNPATKKWNKGKLDINRTGHLHVCIQTWRLQTGDRTCTVLGQAGLGKGGEGLSGTPLRLAALCGQNARVSWGAWREQRRPSYCLFQGSRWSFSIGKPLSDTMRQLRRLHPLEASTHQPPTSSGEEKSNKQI